MEGGGDLLLTPTPIASELTFPLFFLFVFSFVSRFSKSQKRASVLLSDVSQSIFSALAPASAPPTPSLIDEDDDAGSTALGSALLPDVVSVSARAGPPQAPAPPTPESIPKDEEDEDWNW